MTRLNISRRQVIAGAAALGSAASMGPFVALANTAPNPLPVYWDWFKVSPGTMEAWNLAEVEGDRNRVSIRPKFLPSDSTVRKVMVLYPRPSSAYDIAISKMLSVFADKVLDIEFTVINFGNDDARGRAALKFAERHDAALILSMGSETTAWLWDNYRGGALPIVTVCSKDPVVLGQSPGYAKGSGTNFAFTSLNMPIDVQMAYVNELKPRLRNIAVLVDSRNVSAIETQSKPVIDFARSRNIRTLELSVKDPANAKAEIERMMKDATAQMLRNDPDLSNSIYWVTGSTSVFREIQTINAYAGRAAVISVVPEIVRGGDDSAVLSIGISFESNAHMAAIFAAEVLRGRITAGQLAVGVVTPPDIAISFRKVRDIGMTVPLSFFEAAGTIYDYDGKAVRIDGVSVASLTK